MISPLVEQSCFIKVIMQSCNQKSMSLRYEWNDVAVTSLTQSKNQFNYHWYAQLNFSVFICHQAALWMVHSVRLSHIFDNVSLIVIVSSLKFPGVITIYKSDVHAKGQGQRSNVTDTEVKIKFSRFRTVTSVWMHMWRRNDVQSLIWLRRGALLFFKVTRQISRSQGTKIVNLDPNWAFPDCNSSFNHRWLWKGAQSLKWHRKGALLFLKVICQISRSHPTKSCRFSAELNVSGR